MHSLTPKLALCAPQLRDEVNKYRVGAPARVGLVAPNDVTVPAGNTGLDPSQTSFFQVQQCDSESHLPFLAVHVGSACMHACAACNQDSCTGAHACVLCAAQALNIPTKINRGTVEIVTDVALITAGEKVGGSEATLLAKLGIKPFSYGLIIQKVRAVLGLQNP
jgi:large subunit ribosomal protein LP0